ncbi:MAG: hypothetical protein IPM92_16590 [Saprospiraceae bacterium]|nr:hypothetical protein [Saprospiraceae bacterium]
MARLGLQYDQTGVLPRYLVNSVGCDSILELQLEISKPSFQNLSIRSCKDYTWPVNGKSTIKWGIYRFTFDSRWL